MQANWITAFEGMTAEKAGRWGYPMSNGVSRVLRKVRWGLASVLAIASPLALAYMEATGIVPAHPVAGQTVSVHIREGYCDSIVESEGYPVITQSGQHVRILFDTIHSTDSVFCNIPPAEGDLPFGQYEAGNYTLQVDRHYRDIFGDVIEPVGTLTFTVTAPANTAVGVPTLTMVGLALLGVGIAIAAGWRRRRLAT